MRKTITIMSLLIFVSMAVYSDLTLEQPAGGEALTIKTFYSIKWFGPVQEGNQIINIFIEKSY